jgi:hypothetical protein
MVAARRLLTAKGAPCSTEPPQRTTLRGSERRRPPCTRARLKLRNILVGAAQISLAGPRRVFHRAWRSLMLVPADLERKFSLLSEAGI